MAEQSWFPLEKRSVETRCKIGLDLCISFCRLNLDQATTFPRCHMFLGLLAFDTSCNKARTPWEGNMLWDNNKWQFEDLFLEGPMATILRTGDLAAALIVSIACRLSSKNIAGPCLEKNEKICIVETGPEERADAASGCRATSAEEGLTGA